MSFTGFIRRHPLASYFALAYLISWILWLPLIAAAQGWTRTPVPSWWHFFGALGPVSSALIVTAGTEGGGGVRRLLGRLVQLRVGWVWWVLPLLAPFAMFALAGAVLRATGSPWPDFSRLGPTDEFPRMGLVTAFALHAATFGIGEETGWRGFALPRLQSRRGALAATSRLALGWALWHVPAFFSRGGYLALRPEMILGFFVSLFAAAIMFTWMFNSARGSLVPLVLWHGSINIVYTSRVTTDTLQMVMSILIMVWAAVIVVWCGANHLSHRPRVTSPPRPHAELSAAA